MIVKLPPPRHRNWLLWGVFGAVGASLFVMLVTRMTTARGFGSIQEFLQAWLAGTMLFLIYSSILAVAGYFGRTLMVKVMLVGFILATMTLVYFAWRDNSGWGGIAAFAGFLEINILAVIVGAGAELGQFMWSRFKSK